MFSKIDDNILKNIGFGIPSQKIDFVSCIYFLYFSLRRFKTN